MTFLLKALQKLLVESWAANKCNLNNFINNPWISNMFPEIIHMGFGKEDRFLELPRLPIFHSAFQLQGPSSTSLKVWLFFLWEWGERELLATLFILLLPTGQKQSYAIMYVNMCVCVFSPSTFEPAEQFQLSLTDRQECHKQLHSLRFIKTGSQKACKCPT